MGQNLAVQTALNTAGGVDYVNLDASGNVKVAISADTVGALPVTVVNSFVHKSVAAGQTASVIGSAAGDFLGTVVIAPAVVACGAVSILDGATTIFTFAGGGTTALADCTPFSVPINAVCTTSWKITTGANVAVVANGSLTA